jgi:SAM-dependent methyltransferase
MNQDERAPFVRALQRARESAYAPGEYVEQEGFMGAAEIRALAGRAGIAPGVSVLDLCCGVAGPGRFITQEFGCTYLGVDFSSSAIEIARERAGDLPCRFEVARIPPIPPGPYDVVLLFETMLAFPDKETLLQEISGALSPGGRFAFTLEEGLPLTESERERMPDAHTVWLTPLQEMLACLERVGLRVRWQKDCSRSHRVVADSLLTAFAADATAIAGQIGRTALEELLAAHRLWSDWLREGRVRKIAFVAEKGETPPTTFADSGSFATLPGSAEIDRKDGERDHDRDDDPHSDSDDGHRDERRRLGSAGAQLLAKPLRLVAGIGDDALGLVAERIVQTKLGVTARRGAGRRLVAMPPLGHDPSVASDRRGETDCRAYQRQNGEAENTAVALVHSRHRAS